MQRLYALLVIVLLFFSQSGAQAADADAVEVRLFKVQQFLAKSGDPAGQYYLAEMYEKGLGTPQDLQQALVWYKKSAELGNPKAEEKLANWDKNLENARKAKERAETDAKAAELAKLKQQEDAEAAAKAAKAKAAAEAARKAAVVAEPAMPKTTSTSTSATPTGSPKTSDAKNTPAGRAPSTKDKPPPNATVTETKDGNSPEGFTSNPCKGPQAKFLSTCH